VTDPRVAVDDLTEHVEEGDSIGVGEEDHLAIVAARRNRARVVKQLKVAARWQQPDIGVTLACQTQQMKTCPQPLVIQMARPAIDEDDPLTSRQFSIPTTMYKALRKASAVSGKSQAQIVREALVVELQKKEYNGV